ncbi:hypothetical protein [Micromonospora sp. NBC_01796]|nr:hypothetical protein [Micromonospora sp. NBC_01796]WSA88739.1 hypothetical protein OIE47_14670 [Micromonospora sp. NBC_01796]
MDVIWAGWCKSTEGRGNGGACGEVADDLRCVLVGDTEDLLLGA